MVTGAAEREQRQRKHVFVVNGDPPFLGLMRVLLQDARYNVTTTNYVPRTFEQIEALSPDLLIVDLTVGIQAGWDLLEQLQADAITNRIPVVVTSTDPRLLDRARVDQARHGNHRYIVKPFDIGELVAIVEALIGSAEPE